MAVRIEILDYSYSVNTVGGNMIGNSSFADTSCWALTGSWAEGGISGGAVHSVPTATVAYGHLQSSCLSSDFESGVSYRVEYKISGYNQGLLSFKFRGANCTGNLQIEPTNGTHTFDFTQQNCYLDKFGFFASSGFDGSLEYATCYRLTGIDWDKSIVGELEITDHSDFPLALTLQIGNIQDITSTSGDYSKTFKVPATKNNNKLLKHIYNPKVVLQNNPAKYKPCRIIIDGMQSLTGLIKVTGVGGHGKTASYYNCVFYSNNMSWAKGLEEAYLNTLNLPNSTGLTYNKNSIMETWNIINSESTVLDAGTPAASVGDNSSPIVYPVTSYGDFNPDGEDFTIQLLDTKHDHFQAQGTTHFDDTEVGYFGWFDGAGEYGTPRPCADWRPAIFVKSTLEQIFKMAGGYTISSQFMDTDMFKGLVWLLPNFQYNNPDDRYDDLGVEAEWENLSTLTAPATAYITTSLSGEGVFKMHETSVSFNNGANGHNYYYTGVGREVVDIGLTKNLNVTLDGGDSFYMGNDYIKVREYGNYNIEVEGLQVRVARAYYDSSSSSILQTVESTFNVEVQTVGQTSWNIIAKSELELEPSREGYPNGDHSTNRSNDLHTDPFRDIEAIDLKAIWLNKGDKIRFTTGMRVISADDADDNFNMNFWWKARHRASLIVAIDPIGVYWGQTYDLDKVIDPQYKQLDFIKGIAHAFNLVMTTNAEDKIVYIEPFNDFYQTPSNAVDWTSKLDRSREISDKWLPSDLKRNFVFKYKTDNKDAKVKHRGKQFFDGIEDEYPFREILSDEFDKGESIFENPFFAGTFNGQDRDTNNEGVEVHSSCLWQDKGDGLQTSENDWARPDKGFDFLPRLLNWQKQTNLDQTSTLVNYAAKVQTWTSSYLYFINANKNYPNPLKGVYPQATSINRNNALMPVLSYGNVWVRNYYPDTDTYSEYEIGKGLYETYYRGLIEMLKQSPRLRTAYIDLKVKDIVNLNFTKLIYIDDCYWRISRVVDYKPNSNTPTKVELVEWIETGVHALHPPYYGSSGGVGRWGTGEAEAFDWWGNWEA